MTLKPKSSEYSLVAINFCTLVLNFYFFKYITSKFNSHKISPQIRSLAQTFNALFEQNHWAAWLRHSFGDRNCLSDLRASWGSNRWRRRATTNGDSEETTVIPNGHYRFRGQDHTQFFVLGSSSSPWPKDAQLPFLHDSASLPSPELPRF